MSDTVINVENLSKRYIIGHQRDSRDGLRHRLEDAFRNPIKWMLNRKRQIQAAREEFWALKNVSFEIKQGDAVGIIGRNGAGKSTLLKILSRITEPTAGRIRIKGRVASLLEVGTGFHQELTGRENIFLNGAILGMSRAEIKRKFDEIVAFSEVEKFLDTPVKRYSSGMYVRLAFAVAAHLDPEILVIDEVLAVGDSNFQSKCLGKMEDVSKSGRTTLFVSHNMASVQRLCNRCVQLKNGQVARIGDTAQCIASYLNGSSNADSRDLLRIADRSGNGSLRFTSFHIENIGGDRVESVQSGDDFFMVLSYQGNGERPVRRVDVGFSLHTPDTTMLAVLYSSYTGNVFETVPAVGQFRCLVRKLPLKEGRYLIGARITAGGDEADWPREMIGAVDVVAGDFFGSGIRGFDGHAPLLLSGAWSLKQAMKQ